MNTAVTNPAERVGPSFSVDGMLLARNKTREAISKIASGIKAGMVEEDAVDMAKTVMSEMGLALSWHPTRVRFGSNTMKPMKVASVPGVMLKENDIFFLDIAPRVEKWEGDGGKSFVIGHNQEYARCAIDAETLFHDVRRIWEKEKLTGAKLYAFADKTAKEMGWELNFDLPGHRVSDFPHATIYTGSLAEFESSPSPMRWILEIHLRDPQGRFGAFFEDMLLEDCYYR
ncbi:Xaa-Pro aminopeptidase [Herbaspirillum sp. Sphag1AN]|uniref:M24 family metallopeptidase n=1 Tax=unclassified Herbaspirillum TaxID=2624150 RepID=UPI00160A391D|nr:MULTISPECIES: M24 family metallopeptidase [unclassified Herbaspirillum]MBB3211817.1 Xaa-Pro aminopeptidase [Herbaspirillum sp. Sphag1AN]MBB3244349.1 Xaa-Pro aminopeptidase [Herbaspirillum sp. Sphag64]